MVRGGDVVTAPPEGSNVRPKRPTAYVRELRSRRVPTEATFDWDVVGLAQEDGLNPDSQAARFNQIIFGVRLATTAVALALVVSPAVDHGAATYVWAVLVTIYNVFRLLQPLRGNDDLASVARVLVEVALHALAVTFTGAWSSPFVFPLLTAIIVAGFARGVWPALRVSVATSVAVSVVQMLRQPDAPNLWLTNAQWTLFLVLVGIMAGYARRVLGEARTSHTLAMTRVEHLADANRLLSSLHTVAQVLPASLDLDEVLDSTMVRLRELFGYDAAALLLLDDTDGSWRVSRWDGHRLPSTLGPGELPIVLQQAQVERAVRTVPSLVELGGGLVPKMTSGCYGVLTARGNLTGLVVMESLTAATYSDRDADLLRGFLEPAALAIDNAQVFTRLRTVGADEERTRIARDLHDRIGQSLAYVAFELDRLLKTYERGDDVGPSLQRLRGDVRGVIAEVRDTLYDLRTDVSEEQDFVQTMEAFLERVRERSNLRARVVAQVSGRMPLLPERELWRIAQEAVINVERHAKASSVSVTWRTDGRRVELEVVDDGMGFPTGKAGRLDSYGILGMRERAASIGATMEISGVEGRGTVVRCRLDAA
jgi:signal transduction histidine kinase